MAIMRWIDFNEAYQRPYMIFADFPHGQPSGFELLRRLAMAMDLMGSFALFPEVGFIRLAFELDQDAVTFAEGVKAKRTAREGGWSGQWAFGFDAKMQKTIEALLEPIKRAAKPRTGSPRTGLGRKLKRRILPI